MLADVVCALWLLMSVVLGWKRKVKLELPSLLLLAASYVLARIGGMVLAASVQDIIKKGPLLAEAVVTLALWVTLYFVLAALWKKFRPKGKEAGIRIQLDADGNPIVNRGSLYAKSILGALVGLGRGVLLYAGVLYLLLIIVPSTMYKDGRGTVMVHPTSVTLKLLRQLDPTLRRMDDVTQGLQTLHRIRTRSKARRQAMRNKTIRTLLRSKPIRRLSRNRKLLSRAASKRQGRRDSTLLLWLKSYQRAVADPTVAKNLQRIHRAMQ